MYDTFDLSLGMIGIGRSHCFPQVPPSVSESTQLTSLKVGQGRAYIHRQAACASLSDYAVFGVARLSHPSYTAHFTHLHWRIGSRMYAACQ